jgi:Fe-S-cluster containining protein
MSDCKQCGDCCRYIELPLAYVPSCEKVNRFTLPWLLARGIKYELRGDYIWVTLPLQCPYLTALDLCRIHESKPYVCKQGKCPKANDATITNDTT